MKHKSDEILNNVEKMEVSENDVGVGSVENDVKEVNENVARVEVESVEKDVKEVNENGTRDDAIPCFYCDELSFDVKDTESYKTHLREVHSVKKKFGCACGVNHQNSTWRRWIWAFGLCIA